MVSTYPLISMSSSLFTKHLGIVPSAPITTDITITSRFQSWFYYYYYYFTHFRVFHTSVSWWFSSRVLNGSESLQVSRTFLSILAHLNNAVVWMVSIRPLISKSSNPCTNPLVTVASPLITIAITVTFMFHSLFVFFASSSSLLLLSFFCGCGAVRPLS